LSAQKLTEHYQSHVHEFLGSTMVATSQCEMGLGHNHRFAGVTGQVKPAGNSHVHVMNTNTDFYSGHFHMIEVITGEAVPVYDENNVHIGHVHGVTAATSVEDMHSHVFIVATLIQNPTASEER